MSRHNKNKPVIEIKPECSHKWRDFDWYVDSCYYWDCKKQEIKIYEPYVCIYCHQRQDILLDEYCYTNVTLEQGSNYCHKVKELFKDRIKERAIIEDEINDMILVDRNYLKIVDQIEGRLPFPF